MKKCLNGLYIILAIIGGMWLNMEIIFKGIVPLRPVQNFLQQKVTDFAGRPVEMQQVVLRFSGFAIKNVKIAFSVTPQEAQELFSAKEIFFRWNPWYLLKGHIKIDAVLLEQLSAQIVRHEGGRFNFDGLFGLSSGVKDTTAQEKKEVSFPDLSLKNFTLRNSRFSFSDEQKAESIELNDVYLSVQNFAFDKSFPLNINADILYQNSVWPAQKIEMGIATFVNLQKMDLTLAEVLLKHGVIKHEGGVFVAEGKVKNFQTPDISLSVKGKNINQKLADFLVSDIPEFFIKNFTLGLSALADLQKQRLDISKFNFSATDSAVSLRGNLSWAEPLSFSVNGDAELNLTGISQAVPMLQPYQLGGIVKATAQASEQQLQADIILQSVAAYMPIVGTLKEFNTQVLLESLNQLKIEKLEGILNDGPFRGSLALARTEQDITLNADFKADRLALPTPKQQQETPAQKAETKENAWPFPPIHAKVNVDIASLDAPFIYGKDIHFAADMRHITAALSKAHGTLALSTGQGEIKDLNRLTNANAVTKVMFSSLKVVSDVINSLNVFGVLSSLGGGADKNNRDGDMIVQTVLDENGKEIQIMVPHDSEKIDGRWAFEQFATDITFNDGVADVEKGSFVSDMLSFNLQGEMNFQTQALDMTVYAAPGRHYEGGIMPLTLDIGGTMTAPQGKMNLSSSMFSTVTQGVGNNFVSRSVKKIFGGIGSLFKSRKKKETEK